MSGLGRGSALLGTLLLCLMVLQCFEMVHATKVSIVGGRKGWTFDIVSWTKGKRFRAGDVLVFNYFPALHNVVKVSKSGYKTCTTPRGSKFFRTGKDKIKLFKGVNYFICSVPGHCLANMKIAVLAL